MFGRKKRKDAPGQAGQARAGEPIVTAATEPVLPKLPTLPPPPSAPPAAAPQPKPLLESPAPKIESPAPAPNVMASPPPPQLAEPVMAPPPPVAEPAPAPKVEAPAPAPEVDADSLSQADIRARTLLADSIARMESRLSQPEPTPAPAPAPVLAASAGTGAVEALAESVARTASEVARALEQMSSMCAMLAERLDADREERRVLTEAIARLGALPPVASDAPSSVLGGTVFSSPPVARDDDITIIEDAPPAAREIAIDPSPSVTTFASPPVARERETVYADDSNGPAEAAPSASFFATPPTARDDAISIVEEEEEEISIVEDDDHDAPAAAEPVGAGMWCRDDDQWIGGVEIADFVSDNGTIRYWLRRTSDGRMLPRPFDATDLRFVRETSPADG